MFLFALIQYAAPVTSIRGSIGGWTFQSNRAGNIVRLRSGSFKKITSKQSDSIQQHISLLAQYGNLTPAQKILWNDYALAHQHEDKFGNTRTVTGVNWFCTLNANFLRFGLPVVASPPAHALPNGNSTFSVVIDTTKIEITKTDTPSPVDTAFSVWTTPPLSTQSDSIQSHLRLTKSFTTQPFTVLDITSEWETTHTAQWPLSTVANDFRIGIMLQLVNIVSGVAAPGNIIIGEIFANQAGIGWWIIEDTFIIQ